MPHNHQRSSPLLNDIRKRPEFWSNRLNIDVDDLNDAELLDLCDLVGLTEKFATQNSEGSTNPTKPAAHGRRTANVQSCGRFRIKSLLGQGSFATVYHAHDPVLNRDVALKVPRVEILATEMSRARFAREAKLIATLSHPGIVPVFDAGRDGETLYIALELCSGGTLKQVLDKSPVFPHNTAARIVWRLAQAISHAHEKGIVHRDLKPSNIMVNVERGIESEDWPQPHEVRIADFGLAKDQQQTPDEGLMTKSGAVVGTPAYMAPENAGISKSKPNQPSLASDTYSLGTVLYQLLTGIVPLQRESYSETVFAVVFSEPATLRRLDRSIPKDLEAIVFKCLQKETANRYANGKLLAEDLARFLQREPVLARPVTPMTTLKRWIGKNIAVSVMAVATFMFAALAIGIALSKTQGAGESETIAGNDAIKGTTEQSTLEVSTNRGANKKLKPNRSEPRMFTGHAATVSSVAFNSTGRRFVSTSYDQTVKLWNCESGKPIWTNEDHQNDVWNAVWSPDDQAIVTAGWDNKCVLLNADNGEAIRTFEGHTDRPCCVRFTKDGQQIISAALDGTIRFWSRQTGEQLRLLSVAGGKFSSFDLTPDEQFLVAVGWDGRLTKWDLSTEELVFREIAHVGSAWTVLVWPQTNQIITGGEDGFIRLWDLDSCQQVEERKACPDGQHVTHVAVHPNGKQLLHCGHDKQISLWNKEFTDIERRFIGHAHWVYGMAIHPNGKRLASSSVDKTVRIWNLCDERQGMSDR